jgi:hypothetical protein
MIGGGQDNQVTSHWGTIPGGCNNTVTGSYSFAAGNRAKANAGGCFVWADAIPTDFNVGVSDRFAARASGGVYLYTKGDLSTGAYLAANSGSWSSVSDRNAKENFAPVDARQTLKKLACVPISTWNYKGADSNVRHIGPMAQDLYAAFGLGDSDKSITSIDADGISFSAIQGLYQLLQEKETEIAALKSQNDKMERRLAATEALVAKLTKLQEGVKQ